MERSVVKAVGRRKVRAAMAAMTRAAAANRRHRDQPASRSDIALKDETVRDRTSLVSHGRAHEVW
jgi:hypothetical protein